MMANNQEQTGCLAFLCDQQGKIIQILKDELGLTPKLASGVLFTSLVDRHDFSKSLSFMAELHGQNVVFDWELDLLIDDKPMLFYFAGSKINEYLLIIGANPATRLLEMYEAMMVIANEQSNMLRLLMKLQAEDVSTALTDEAAYNEITNLNNELMNTQRQLAKKNIELEQLNQELQRLNTMKNNFLGIVAHDLRGPLGNIQLSSNLLNQSNYDFSDEERQSLLQDIESQAVYMIKLVSGLLDITKIETGNLELNLELVDLTLFLYETIVRHGHLAAVKGTSVMLADVPQTHIVADKVRLRQIMDNLISNAVKYSPPGSTITLWADELPDAWRVHVKDQGPGISETDRSRLFQDFARLSAKPTAGEQSIGLGLAITRRMVVAHGGQIGVESVVGQGATFWFTLPKRSI